MILPGFSAPPFEFRVEQGKGLTVEVNGVAVIRGSAFQYYEPDWTKGYYSSTYKKQVITQTDGDTISVRFSDGDVSGLQTFHREGNHLKVHSEFKWNGDHPIKVEYTAGHIWAPAFEAGTLTANGKPTRKLDSYSYSTSELGERRFAPDTTTYALKAPLSDLNVIASRDLTMFDGRGYKGSDWATGKSLFWLGALTLDVAKGKTTSIDVDFSLNPHPVNTGSKRNIKLTAMPFKSASTPDEGWPILIPKPRTEKLNWERPIEFTGNYAFPVGPFSFFDEFKAGVARRYLVPKPKGKAINFDGGVSKLGLVPGGFRITIKPDSVSVLGEEEEGLHNGLARLSQMVFLQDGKLWLPTGTVVDSPNTAWRGVHLFVGPNCIPFHKALWTRVLKPLGFNHVVLQCERADWTAIAGTETSLTMKKSELAQLFKWYRSIGVEPIPLIQSYGHAEWIFANGKNRDLAMNPDEPYALDPRKPGTKQLLTKIWSEAIDLLHPATVHFGLDEVDMIGVPEEPKLETELWKQQVGFLTSLAKEEKVGMMLWGDQMLAPGEAPDATLGDSKEEAAQRRSALAKGTFVADWHYKEDSRYSEFTKSLRLWKDAGMKPIASGWFAPENVRGFAMASAILDAGYLQTTWNGYTNDFSSLRTGFDQYAACVLAADYSWGVQSAELPRLNYQYRDVFRRMWNDDPSELTPTDGFALVTSDSLKLRKVGRTSFKGGDLGILSSPIQPGPEPVSELSLEGPFSGNRLVIACATLARAEEGETVATCVVELSNGKTVERALAYGSDLRSADDTSNASLAQRGDDGLFAIRLELPPASVVKRIRFVPRSLVSGLRLAGITLF